jgi:hypothetical protein
MTTEKKDYPVFSYDTHARKCAPDDFLGQVRRTVNGAPVSDDQIAMILAAINAGLALRPDDVVLELACGNGALSHTMFDNCKGYLGTDVSDYLISVARRHFERLPDYRFDVRDGLTCLQKEPRPEHFTKALCYAGFQYFTATEATEMLSLLAGRFTRLQRVFIGNMPDRDKAANFYLNRTPSKEELADCSTAIGIWRTKLEFEALARAAGWDTILWVMPAAFQSSYYRFDAVLTRPAF